MKGAKIYMEKERTEKKIWQHVVRKLVVILIVVLMIFSLATGVWYFGYRIKFDEAAKGLTVATNSVGDKRWIGTIDSYQITVAKPTGLLKTWIEIAEPIQGELYMPIYDEYGNVIMDEAGNIMFESGPLIVSLFVWPQLFDDCDFGVFFEGGPDNVQIQLMIDEELNILDADMFNEDEIEFFENLIEEKEDVIREQLDIAKNRISG